MNRLMAMYDSGRSVLKSLMMIRNSQLWINEVMNLSTHSPIAHLDNALVHDVRLRNLIESKASRNVTAIQTRTKFETLSQGSGLSVPTYRGFETARMMPAATTNATRRPYRPLLGADPRVKIHVAMSTVKTNLKELNQLHTSGQSMPSIILHFPGNVGTPA